MLNKYDNIWPQIGWRRDRSFFMDSPITSEHFFGRRGVVLKPISRLRPSAGREAGIRRRLTDHHSRIVADIPQHNFVDAKALAVGANANGVA